MDHGVEIEVDEYDIARGKNEDLLDGPLWLRVLVSIRARRYDCVIASPPCSTWCRIPYSHHPGPDPLRSKTYPWGFPWVEGTRRKKLDDHNTLMRRALEACEAAGQCGAHFILECPEDLGTAYNEHPASAWQLPDMISLAT